MSNIKERLDKAKEKFADKSFQQNKGLGNEVGIHIFAYNPEDEMVVRHFIKSLDKETAFHAIRFDLYQILLDYLLEREIFDEIEEYEKDCGKDKCETLIKNMVSPEVYVEKMKYNSHKTGDILIISGIGKVYPFTRVHTLLENVATEFKDIPIVVFYPGSYDQKSLRLFNRFFDDNHYRSFILIK